MSYNFIFIFPLCRDGDMYLRDDHLQTRTSETKTMLVPALKCTLIEDATSSIKLFSIHALP